MRASRPETVRSHRAAPAGRIAGATLLITIAMAIVGQPAPAGAESSTNPPPAKVAPPAARAKKPAASSTPAGSAATTAPATVTKNTARPGTTPAKAGATPAKVASAQTRMVIVPPKPSSTLAPQDERVTYHYNALGRRDPFQPLVGGGFIGADVGGNAPPDIGGIKVVGIVWGTNDQFALVEDPRGNSLVLRQGDKVMDGYVDSLKRDAVIVKLSVDGQTQMVSIPLTRKGEQSK